MELEFKIDGLEEFNKTIQEMVKSLDPDKVEPILRKGAKAIADEARDKAPIGPTGNLKKSVKVKQLKRLSSKQPAPVIVAFDRKKAPHTHLVVHGTKDVRKVDPKKNIFHARDVGRMPSNPFFDKAINAKVGEAYNLIEKGVSNLVEEAAKK